MRPKHQGPKSAVNREAAERMCMLADVKISYYKEKSAMKHELLLKEHAVRIRLLELQLNKLEK